MNIKYHKITYKSLRCLAIVFVAFCLSLMFHVKKTDNMDFVRHQELLNDIRNSNIRFKDYVLNNPLGSEENKTFSFTYSFNVVCYIVAKLFKNNYVLVWISALIEYGIIAYIAYDWKRNSKYTLFQVLFSVLLCFAIYPMIHAFSGIRTSMASSLMALAVYLYLYKNCSIFKFFIVCFISVTCHPVMFLAVPIALAVKISSSPAMIALILIITLFFNRIAILFEQSNIPLLNVIAVKYLTYTSENQYRAWRFCLYGVILICFTCIFYYILVYKTSRKEKPIEKKMNTFLVCFMSLILGNIGGYEMVMRPSYLLGALSPIIVSMLTEQDTIDSVKGVADPVKTVIKFGVTGIVLALSVYMGIKYIYYVGEFFV